MIPPFYIEISKNYINQKGHPFDRVILAIGGLLGSLFSQNSFKKQNSIRQNLPSIFADFEARLDF